jgi:excisionase family DNA binding protein
MSDKAVIEGPSNPFVLSGSSPPEQAPLSNKSKRVTSSPDKQFFENKIDIGPSQDRWFSTKEAADYLRIPVGTLRNMTSNGQITHYKLGRLNRYLESDLKKLLLSQKRGV